MRGHVAGEPRQLFLEIRLRRGEQFLESLRDLGVTG